jgi:hypothetical protein
MALGERAAVVFRSAQEFCEWRLGKASLPGRREALELTIPVSELVQCLRQIQKSIPRWSGRGGR